MLLYVMMMLSLSDTGGLSLHNFEQFKQPFASKRMSSALRDVRIT